MIAKIKRSLWVGVIAGILMLGGVLYIQTGTVSAQEAPKKVWVCKYVGTPNVDERLQTGNNPISVSVNTLKGWDGSTFPFWFPDAQGRSAAIDFDTSGNGGGQEGEPTLEDCPAPSRPTTALAGVTILPATCQAGEKLIYGEIKNATVKTGSTADGTFGPIAYTVTFTASEGATFEGDAKELVLQGSLAGASTEPRCETGQVLGGTSGGAGSVTGTPVSLPNTSGEAGIIAVVAGSLLTIVVGFAGASRLLSRSL